MLLRRAVVLFRAEVLKRAGAGHKASHNIYMWDRDSGGLVKILEGPKDPLEDLDVRIAQVPVLWALPADHVSA